MRLHLFMPILLLAPLLPMVPLTALAEGMPPQAALEAASTGPFIASNAVGEASLDGARGGFIAPGGLVVTLGLERLVTINGNVVERTEMQLGDIGKLASGQGSISGEALGQLRLIQNGDVRAVTQEASGLLGGTLIQNTLNDQLIQNRTAITATVNTAGMLRALNFGTSMNNVLTTAIAPR